MRGVLKSKSQTRHIINNKENKNKGQYFCNTDLLIKRIDSFWEIAFCLVIYVRQNNDPTDMFTSWSSNPLYMLMLYIKREVADTFETMDVKID